MPELSAASGVGNKGESGFVSQFVTSRATILVNILWLCHYSRDTRVWKGPGRRSVRSAGVVSPQPHLGSKEGDVATRLEAYRGDFTR